MVFSMSIFFVYPSRALREDLQQITGKWQAS